MPRLKIPIDLQSFEIISEEGFLHKAVLTHIWIRAKNRCSWALASIRKNDRFPGGRV